MASGTPIVRGDPYTTARDFAKGLGQYDPAILKLIAPGTDAHVYAEGAIAIHDADPANNPTRVPREADGGWRFDSALLSDFTFDSIGAITGLSRNGIPIDTIVAAGDGTAVAPDGDSSADPALTVTVHSARDLSDNLGILLLITNNDDQQAVVSFDRYRQGGGESLVYAESDGIAAPNSTTFLLVSVQGGTGGGTLHGEVVRPAEGIDDIVLEVPSLD